MSTADDTAAILAAINAKFTSRRAYEFGDPLARTLTTDHILVAHGRRFVPTRRASNEVSLPGGRTVTRYVAKTTGNLAAFRDRVTAALEDQILPGDLGPFAFEGAGNVDDDEGWLVADDTWTS